MSHPDDFGVRVAQFPNAHKQMLEQHSTQPQTPSDDPHERAAPVLDQIALDLLWLPYGEMLDFAKEIVGADHKAPATPNEMADVIHRWAKNRVAGK